MAAISASLPVPLVAVTTIVFARKLVSVSGTIAVALGEDEMPATLVPLVASVVNVIENASVSWLRGATAIN